MKPHHRAALKLVRLKRKLQLAKSGNPEWELSDEEIEKLKQEIEQVQDDYNEYEFKK
jgi:uncharacterized protein (DUF305 family)